MFGCGEDGRTYRFGDEAAAALLRPAADSLWHRDEVRQEALDALLSDRLRRHASRPSTPAGPAFGSPAGGGGRPATQPTGEGHLHVIPSTTETVRLGVFDSTLPNLVDVDSGDVVVFPDTWSHFLNRMQPGVPVEQLARWRAETRGAGPHSIVGPVGVRSAQPGDVIAVHYQRLEPVDWGANFNNPGSLGTGALPDEFPEGQVRYLSLDSARQVAMFAPGIELPLAPFQGTLAVAPAQGGVVSSVAPGQHAGNVDLLELTEGSVEYIPVWQPGAKLYTGDSHALQGDGEVNLTALETAMREVRIQVVLHERAGWQWPFAETPTHWIALGMDVDLNEAFRIALRNTLDFLQRRAGLSRLDAYALASLAVSFRVTQVVDVSKGVHAMIPKAIFLDDARSGISVV